MSELDPSTPANTSALRTGIIIVDHGSRRDESNRMLEEIARLFARRFAGKYDIVEPAHMEISEPSIAAAYAACAARGAQRIVVCPFFLGPGKHWTSDIPRLTATAALEHPGTHFHVAQTLGIDDLILDLLEKRASHCEEHEYLCSECEGSLRSGRTAMVNVEEEKPKTSKTADAPTCGSCPFKGQPLPAQR